MEMIKMLDAKLEYRLVLKYLEDKKKKEKNPKKLELLEKSIKEINERLNPSPKKMTEEEKIKLRKQREIELNKKTDAINSFFSSKMFRDYEFSCLQIFNMNNKKLEATTLKFIKNTKHELSKSFKNAKITPLKQKRRHCGTTIYVKTLDKSYVFISKNDMLTKAITLIHELGHARVCDVRKENIRSRCFNEVYPKFLELVFSDYLIQNGLEKHGYNVKVKLLNEIKYHIFQIKNYDEDGQIFLAQYNYNVIKDNILAIYLYLMYKKTPNEILTKLNTFIDSLGKKNEEELLNIFGLDSSIFTDLNISDNFKSILEAERNEIKQK